MPAINLQLASRIVYFIVGGTKLTLLYLSPQSTGLHSLEIEGCETTRQLQHKLYELSKKLMGRSVVQATLVPVFMGCLYSLQYYDVCQLTYPPSMMDRYFVPKASN